MRIVLLAGGKSIRMGCDKMFLPFQGKPLIQYMIERLLEGGYLVTLITNSANHDKMKLSIPANILQNISIHQDVYPDKGPIGGIFSGLYYSKESYVFVLAADLPFFKRELMNMMENEIQEFEAVIPQTEKGLEPLFALYKQSCQSIFLGMIQKNQLKISASYEFLSTKIIPKETVMIFDPNCESFVNINTQEDYKEMIRLE